jgi:hypothetical protein
MKSMRLLLAPFIALLAHGSAAQEAPQTLGRLFMTPEWRSQLDRQRHLNIQETRSLEGGTMRLDGVVVRSSGKTTVWVNNSPQTDDARGTGVLAGVSRQQPGRATLTVGSESPADMKVGTTLDRTTRETSGGLAGGEIRVNRAK